MPEEHRSALTVETKEGKDFVFDPVRKKLVALTPEEEVRQRLILALLDLGYPRPLMAVEKGVELNGMARRFDLLVYSRKGEPLLIAECKAPSVKITQAAFDQVSQYNTTLKVPVVVVTNGSQLFICQVDHSGGKYEFVDTIPEHHEAELLVGH